MRNRQCHYTFRKAVLGVSFVSVLLSCGVYTMNNCPFTYPSGKQDYETTTFYDDSLFDEASNVYSPTLATTSLSFAMASFASSETSAIRTLTRYRNAEKLLAESGFLDFDVNESYKKRSETDTIGLVFAHKQIKGKELVYVGIRGANYEKEWASNLSIADPNADYDPETSSPYHYGFHLAATNLIEDTKNYIAKVGIKGDIKLWTSGFSRAGATANLAGGLIDQALEKGEKPLGTAVNLKKEDFYVYCFEPPMGAPIDADGNGKLNARSEKYNNIFCHVNFNDPVPLVAMKEVGYTRFGIDRYYPDAMTYIDYQTYEFDWRNQYSKVPSYGDKGGIFPLDNFKMKTVKKFKLVDDLTAQSWTQGLYLREFVSELTRFGLGAADEEHMDEAKISYVHNIQPAVRALFEIIYRSENFRGSLIDLAISMINDLGLLTDGSVDMLFDDLFHEETRQYFFDDLTSIVRRGFEQLGIKLTLAEADKDLRNLVKVITDFLIHVITGLGYIPLVATLFNLEGDKAFGAGHYPELSLAATRALDRNYEATSFENTNWAGKHYSVRVFNTNDAASVKRNNKTIASGNKEKMDANIPARATNKFIEFILPYGESYTVFAKSDAEVEVTMFDYTVKGNMVNIAIDRASDGSFEIQPEK